jgi:hypothetical protein
MKKITTLIVLLIAFTTNAQVFSGKGDVKFQIGANMPENGTGINVTTDFGLGENMSFGFAAVYLLNAERINDVKPDFEDRADLKVRFNANIGNVLNISDAVDIYPGLSLGLRNFGGHVGIRYFFTDGFGVYSEAGFPIASYKPNLVGFDKYNNQFTFNIGASFNIQ